MNPLTFLRGRTLTQETYPFDSKGEIDKGGRKVLLRPAYEWLLL